MRSILIDQFCVLIKSEMEKQGLTQVELAARSGVHWVTINRILNHSGGNLGFDTAEKLLRGVGIRPETLFQNPRTRKG